jgi:peptide/nickel transport system substrate-binding protein
LDDNFLYRSSLAERWNNPNPLTYVFALRKNSLFHDGTRVSAADVKFTFDWILNPANASPKRTMLDRIREVQTEEPDTVIFRLKEPFAPFMEAALVKIVPRRRSLGEKTHASGLIGSGPYRFAIIRPEEEIVLERSETPPENSPRLKRLVFRIIPDSVVRTLELKKGAIDFVQNEVDPDTIPWLERKGGIRTIAIPGTIVQYLGMNCEDRHLKNKEVRQAISFALNRKGMIGRLLRGFATEATGLLSPHHWAYEADVERYPYDPERAKRMLDRAGFPDPDGDGPKGRFSLTYKTSTLDLRRRIAEAVQEQLEAVGITIEIRTYEFATLYADVRKGNFHIYSMDWVGINDPDLYHNLFHSKSIPPTGNNRGRFRHFQMDLLTDEGRRTLDVEARRRIYGKVQRLAARELPLIPLWWFTNVALMNPRVRGFIPHPSGSLLSLTKTWKQ